MAIAFGASLGTPVNDTDNLGATIALTGVTVPSGSRVVVKVSWYNNTGGTTASMGTSGGLTWTQEVTKAGTADANRNIAEFSAHAPSGLSGATLTCTFSNSAFGRGIQGFYATGLDTSTSAKDVSATNAQSQGSIGDFAWTSTAATTTVADTLISGFSWVDGRAVTNTPTSATEITDVNNSGTGNNASWVQEYRIESATGSNAMAGTWVSLGTSEVLSLMVAYKADSVTPWPPAGTDNDPATLRLITAPRLA